MNWLQKIESKIMQLSPQNEDVLKHIIDTWKAAFGPDEPVYYANIFKAIWADVVSPYTGEREKVKFIVSPLEPGSFSRTDEYGVVTIDSKQFVKTDNTPEQNYYLDENALQDVLRHELIHAIDPKLHLGEERQEYYNSLAYIDQPAEIDAYHGDIALLFQKLIDRGKMTLEQVYDWLRSPRKNLPIEAEHLHKGMPKYWKAIQGNPEMVRKLKERIYNYLENPR